VMINVRILTILMMLMMMQMMRKRTMIDRERRKITSRH
jgi:hypothetical protein